MECPTLRSKHTNRWVMISSTPVTPGEREEEKFPQKKDEIRDRSFTKSTYTKKKDISSLTFVPAKYTGLKKQCIQSPFSHLIIRCINQVAYGQLLPNPVCQDKEMHIVWKDSSDRIQADPDIPKEVDL